MEERGDYVRWVGRPGPASMTMSYGPLAPHKLAQVLL